MSLSANDVESLAERLWQARLDSKPCRPLTQSHPEMTVQDAYEISRVNFNRRLKAGEKTLGRKIGLTSAAVQKQLGVDRPDFGYLSTAMAVRDGGEIPKGALIQAKVEGEVAFVLKTALRGPGIKIEDVMKATDAVAPCIEIIDSRIENWKIKIQDTVADNASSAYFALGAYRRPPRAADLAEATMELKIDGRPSSSGRGTACLGNPAAAVAWLANALAELGDGLEAGDVILSGALGPVVLFPLGVLCGVEISGVGAVSCRH